MIHDCELTRPFTPTMLDAICNLLAVTELPRQGNYFVSPDGSRHMARTIGALVKHNCCRVCQDKNGHEVARINEGIRSVVDAQLAIAAAKRRALLAAEADELAERELV